MQTGYYKDISNNDYHASEGISKSQLDLVHKSPALLYWLKNTPEDLEKKKSLDFGTAFHCLILEPERFKKEYAIGPENAPKNTKDGKDKWAEFEASLTGNEIVITGDEFRKLKLMQESTLSHPYAKALLEADGDTEASIYWNEATTGELARCRLDKNIPEFMGRSFVLDIKTIANFNNIERSFYDYRYYVQDPFYSDGYKAQFNVKPVFCFLVVSTSIDCGRYPIRLFILDDIAKDMGRREYLEDIASYSQCKASGKWLPFETLSLPYWAIGDL